MGSINCKKCGVNSLDDYDNPVFIIRHMGKLDKVKLCSNCLMDRYPSIFTRNKDVSV